MADYLSWPPDSLDPHRLAAQAQVVRVVTMVAAKVGSRRSRERERALAAWRGNSRLPPFTPQPPGQALRTPYGESQQAERPGSAKL